MLQQDLTNLDFDSYFNIATSDQQQQQQQQDNNRENTLYYQQQMNGSPSSLLSDTTFQNDSDNNNNLRFFTTDWESPLDHNSFISSPNSSLNGCATNSILSSPQLILNSPPLYSNQNFNQENLINKQSPYQFAGINIPSTPTENIAQTTINLPSPPMENNKDSFINNWMTDKHETRNWRFPSSRREQLNQPQTVTFSYFEPGQQLKKVAHNAIERRYRNNINDRIRELKNVVPALYKAKIKEKGEDDDDSTESGGDEITEIVDGVEVAKKLNKATILRKATEYIHFLKQTNENVDQENLILQQIISQLPGGQNVLSQFLSQKAEFKRQQQDLLARERQERQEFEKLERQRILRERAAQRAALAKIIPKPARKPYSRRKPTKKDTKKETNKSLMVAFMSVVFFTAIPSSNSSHDDQLNHHNMYATKQSTNYWSLIRNLVFVFGIFYVVIFPWCLKWLGLRRCSQKKNVEHQHYSDEISDAWKKLYKQQFHIERDENSVNYDKDSFLIIIIEISAYIVSLVIPKSLTVMFNKQTYKDPNELVKIHLNEVECLGGNPDVTCLGMLHSCLGMLSHLHQIRRDEKYSKCYEPNAITRIYATAALQLELCLPKFISKYTSEYFWDKVNLQYSMNTEEWLNSTCHDQVLHILQVRNGFYKNDDHHCRNVFYSYALPYITSPLNFVLYWQQLEQLTHKWDEYFSNAKPVFSSKLLEQASFYKKTPILNWCIMVGLALESINEPENEYLEKLDKCFNSNDYPLTSSLLKQYQSVVYYMLKATHSLETKSNHFEQYLQKSLQQSKLTFECINQISSCDYYQYQNLEASILALSSLAVHLHTFKALIQHNMKIDDNYIAELRKLILQDLELPCTKSLKNKYKRHIRSIISQTYNTRHFESDTILF